METTVLMNDSEFHELTTVLVRLSGNGGPSGRITVDETLSLGELGVLNASSGEAPVYPHNEINSINSSAASAADKLQMLMALTAAYQEAVEEYEAHGGVSLEDRVVVSVVDWLVANKGFSRTDTGNGPVISENQLSLKTVKTFNDVFISVSGQAVWG